jgi:hypothetical protein
LEAVFILLLFPSPSRRIFIGSHSLPPSLVRRIGPSRVPLDEPGNIKRIVRNKKRSRKTCKETDDHHLRRAPARLPSASSLARRLLLLLAMELLGVLVLKKESLDWQRLGKQRTW